MGPLVEAANDLIFVRDGGGILDNEIENFFPVSNVLGVFRIVITEEIVAVPPDLQLVLRWVGEEVSRGFEELVALLQWHAVVDDLEESPVLAGQVNL